MAPGRDEQVVDALEALALARLEIGADEVVEVGPSSQLLVEGVGETRERASRSRLDRAERDLEPIGDLALREPAPVRELDDGPLVLGKHLERAVHAPRGPRGLGLVRRVGIAAGTVLELGRPARASAGARP